jgi:hypothetical protein
MIGLNQPLTINSTITNGGTVVDLSSAVSVKYKYWKPSNTSLTEESGEFEADIDDALLGTVHYDIHEDVLDEVGNWRFRGVAEFSNGIYPADIGQSIIVEAETRKN